MVQSIWVKNVIREKVKGLTKYRSPLPVPVLDGIFERTVVGCQTDGPTHGVTQTGGETVGQGGDLEGLQLRPEVVHVLLHLTGSQGWTSSLSTRLRSGKTEESLTTWTIWG